MVGVKVASSLFSSSRSKTVWSLRLLVVLGLLLGSAFALTRGASAGTLATDNFNRANGSLGSAWTPTSDGSMSIASQQVIGKSGATTGDIRTAETYPSDQFSQIQVTSTPLSGGGWIAAAVRLQDSGQSGYAALYYWNYGSPELMLFIRNSGGWSQLGSSYNSGVLAAGAQVQVTAVGSTISVQLNGVTRISVTDTSFTGGAPGILAYGNSTADNWSGGSASSAGTAYTVGGSVSGLSGTVVLQDNGGDNLSVTANGPFTFATPVASGSAYAVTVKTSPSGQTCSVSGGSGTMGSANITNVTVSCTSGGQQLTVSYVSTDGNGVATYNMTSPIVSGGATEPLRVLKPTNPAAGVAHNFLIALPVEPGEGTTYGDAMSTLESLNAQNKYNLTIVEPSFSIDPWYANSATDPTEQMETFMTNQLVPWIKANLATTGKEQVWLIGFSKSGVGGQDLILKHPSVYTLAASWDFPDSPSYDALGSSEATAYGTNANFLANYQLSQAFVNTYAAPFTQAKRLWIGGYYYFDWDVYNDYAPELVNANVKYDAETATQMAHNWGSGWVPGALAALYQDSIHLPS
jgi:hypothetical protein